MKIAEKNNVSLDCSESTIIIKITTNTKKLSIVSLVEFSGNQCDFWHITINARILVLVLLLESNIFLCEDSYKVYRPIHI